MNSESITADRHPPTPRSIFLAWFSVFAPFAVALVTFVVVKSVDGLPLGTYQKIAGIAYGCELLLLFCSFVTAVTSLFGIPRYGAHRILVPAVIGILASGGLGFMAFVFWVMSGMGHM
jgi:hypothetical protein